MNNSSTSTGVPCESGTTSESTSRFTFSAAGVICAAVCATIIWFAPLFGAYLGIVSVLIAVHEAAHMVVARRNGLAVLEYSVGFGPKVISLTTSKMAWSIRGLPIGGFVKIAGPTVESEVPEGISESETLRGCSSRARVATIAAGPLSNLVLAVVLSAAAFGIIGHAGADGERVRLSPTASVLAGVNDVTATGAATVQGLAAIVTQPGDYTAAVASGEREDAPAAFLSPVGASNLIGDLGDPALLLRFAAIISAGLGVFNFFPFPPLDGGHLMVELIERVRSRNRAERVRVSTRMLNVAAGATLGFLLVLTVTALRFDLAV